ncbi:Golgi apparatus membrane protein TVP23 A, partial [Podila humilis]
MQRRIPRTLLERSRDFIKSLLRAHPEKRMTATEALQHKWITTETGTDVDLLDNVKEGFNAKRMFKKSVRAVAAANRLRTMSMRSNTDASGFEGVLDSAQQGNQASSYVDSPASTPPVSGAAVPVQGQATVDRQNLLSDAQPMGTNALEPDLEAGQQESILKQSSHPVCLIFHFLFRIGAICTYFFGSWFTNNFVLIFVLCVLMLVFDFWTVKNVSGRLLVGLRWWSENRED